jgi:hypothetical protein
MNRRGDDRGQVMAFVAVLAVGLVFVAGLAWDGGQFLKAYVHASDLAESAARAAAQATEPDDLAAGRTSVDPAAARARAGRFLADAGEPGSGSVSVAGSEVTVTVTVTQSAHILPLGSRRISATASATPQRGVQSGEGI